MTESTATPHDLLAQFGKFAGPEAEAGLRERFEDLAVKDSYALEISILGLTQLVEGLRRSEDEPTRETIFSPIAEEFLTQLLPGVDLSQFSDDDIGLLKTLAGNWYRLKPDSTLGVSPGGLLAMLDDTLRGLDDKAIGKMYGEKASIIAKLRSAMLAVILENTAEQDRIAAVLQQLNPTEQEPETETAEPAPVVTPPVTGGAMEVADESTASVDGLLGEALDTVLSDKAEQPDQTDEVSEAEVVEPEHADNTVDVDEGKSVVIPPMDTEEEWEQAQSAALAAVHGPVLEQDDQVPETDAEDPETLDADETIVQAAESSEGANEKNFPAAKVIDQFKSRGTITEREAELLLHLLDPRSKEIDPELLAELQDLALKLRKHEPENGKSKRRNGDAFKGEILFSLVIGVNRQGTVSALVPTGALQGVIANSRNQYIRKFVKDMPDRKINTLLSERLAASLEAMAIAYRKHKEAAAAVMNS